MTRNGVYEVVSEILMYDGMIEPDTAYHFAHKADLRTQHLLSIEEYGSAQTLVGNTLIEHRTLAYLPVSQWKLRLWIKSLFHVRTRHNRCICGWNEPGICIEYHQADMINAAMLRHQASFDERTERLAI